MSVSPGKSQLEDSIVDVKMSLNDEFLSVQDENVIIQSETLPVYTRVRPLLPVEILNGHKECLTVINDNVICIVAPEDSIKYKNCTHNSQELIQNFSYTQTFGPEVNQLCLFEQTMKDTVQNFIEGQNSLVFAYGSSGSGKTFTMQGATNDPGVIPLTVQLLFECVKERQVLKPNFMPVKEFDVLSLSPAEQEEEDHIKESLLSLSEHEEYDSSRSNMSIYGVSLSSTFSDNLLADLDTTKMTSSEIAALQASLRIKSLSRNSFQRQGDIHYGIWVSFVEIYNELIYDLLQPFTKGRRPKLNLSEDKHGNIYVKGLKEIHVTNTEEVIKLLNLGRKNLRIASTKLNYQSSRSHCIFNIKIVRIRSEENGTAASVNKLSFCDLAGSERHSKTQNTGARLKEAGSINTSLLVLGRCIEMLRLNQTQREKKVIPFRESKLTRLFSGFFTGKGRASMIVNVSPSSYTFDETLNVLKFSALARKVTVSDLPVASSDILLPFSDEYIEQWNNNTRRLSKQRESVEAGDTTFEDSEINEADDSYIEDGRDKLIKDMIPYIRKLEADLKKEKEEKANLATEIRDKIRLEYSRYITNVENNYKKQIQVLQDISDRAFQKRLMSIQDYFSHPQDLSSCDEDEVDNEETTHFESSEEMDSYVECAEEIVVDTVEAKYEQIAEVPEADHVPILVVNLEAEKLNEMRKSLSENENFLTKDKIISQLELKISELQAFLSTKKQDIAGKNEALSEAGDIVINKNKEIESLEGKLFELKDLVEMQDQQLSDRNREWNKTIIMKDAETSKLKSEIEELLKEAQIKDQQFNDRTQEWNKNIAQKDNEINKLNTEIEELNKAAQLKDQEINNISHEMSEKIAIKDEEINTLKMKVELITEELSSKVKQFEEQELSLKETDVALLAKDEEIAKLEKNIAEMQDMLTLQEIKHKNTDEELTKMEQELASKNKVVEKLQAENEVLKENVNSKEAKILKQEEMFEKAGEMFIDKEVELNELKDTVQQFERRTSIDAQKVQQINENIEARLEVPTSSREIQTSPCPLDEENVKNKDELCSSAIISELKSEIVSLEEELNATKEQLKEKSEENGNLQQKLSDEKTNFLNLEKEVKDNYEKSLSEMEAKLQQKEHETVIATVENDEKVDSSLEIKEHILKLVQVLCSASKDVKLTEDSKDCFQSLQEIQTASLELIQKNKSLECRIDRLNDNISALEETVAESKKDCFELKKDRNELKYSLEEKCKELVTKQAINCELEKRIVILDSDITAVNLKFADANAELNTIKEDLLKAERTIDSLNEINKNQSTMIHLLQKIEYFAFLLRKKEKEAEEENDPNKSKECLVQADPSSAGESLEQQISELTKKVKQLQNELEEAKKLQTDLQTLRENVDDVLDNYDKPDNISLLLSVQLAELKAFNRCEQLQEENDKLIAENGTITSEIAAIKNKEKNLKERCIAAEDSLANLKYQMESREKELREIKNRVKGLETALKEAQEKLKMEQIKNSEKLREEREQHSTEVEQIIKLKQMLEEENRKLKSQVVEYEGAAIAVQREKEFEVAASAVQTQKENVEPDESSPPKKAKVDQVKQSNARAARTKQSAISKEKENAVKKPERTQSRYLRSTRRKDPVDVITLEEDEEEQEDSDEAVGDDDDEFLPTSKKTNQASNLKKRPSRRKADQEEEKQTSPLKRLRQYMSVKAPRLRAVAQQVKTYLSPVPDEKKPDSEITAGRRKRKLFTDDAAPMVKINVPETRKPARAESTERSKRSTRKQWR